MKFDRVWLLIGFLMTCSAGLVYILVATKSSNIQATVIEKHLIDDRPKMYFKIDKEIIEAATSMANFVEARQDNSQWCIEKFTSKYFPDNEDDVTYRVLNKGQCSKPS